MRGQSFLIILALCLPGAAILLLGVYPQPLLDLLKSILP